MFENIKSILHFSNAYELLEDAGDIEILSELSEEEEDFLRSIDDYEPLSFFLINDDTVIICDSINGDASGHPMSIQDFQRETINYVKESCGGYEE